MNAADPGFQAALPWLISALLCGYLLGSIPFGVLVARVFGLGDLRKVGSGNIGATNVLRTGNKLAAAATLLLDAGKGAGAVLLMARWGPDAALLAGLGAFLGHCFPIWLRFSGGKGVATFLGALLALSPPAGAMACGAWLVVALLLRYSSLAALVAAALSPVFLLILSENGMVLIVALMAAILIVRHHANIGRLIRGRESRIGGS